MILPQDLKDFVREHESDNIHELALHAKQYPGIDMQAAIRQITGRKIAREKIPSWYAIDSILYPKHISMEQCSSEQTARYKAGLVEGDSMVDLTGGFGIDFAFMAVKFRKKAVYAEQQKELSEIASYNFGILGLKNVSVENTDALTYLSGMPFTDLIYIDPARRDAGGKKMFRIEDCSPNILEIEDLLEKKAAGTIIKLSPMLDLTLALKSLRNISDVHIVSVENECKELLLVKDKAKAGQCIIHCINIQKNGTDKLSLRKEQEDSAKADYTASVGKYLYEPNTSLLKAGIYKYTAERYQLKKLHPDSHLYTSDDLRNDFQGRRFVVDNICSLGKKDIKQYLPGIGQANITTRNFPLSVQEIRKKTKLKDGGDVYIFATTLSDNSKVLIICHKA
jgi:hypothetical protein